MHGYCVKAPPIGWHRSAWPAGNPRLTSGLPRVVEGYSGAGFGPRASPPGSSLSRWGGRVRNRLLHGLKLFGEGCDLFG